MSCSSPERELVSFWLAGTLDPDEAAQVARHVDECPDCRADVVAGRVLVDGLRALHLTAEEVVSAAAGEFNTAHLLVCAQCRDEVARLRTVNADLGARATSARRWRPIGLAIGIAAALFLAVWIIPHRTADDRSAIRGDADVGIAGLLATTDAGGVPTFSWTLLAAATSYRLEVFSADGQPAWSRDVGAPPVRWPADAPRTLGAYRWRVDALSAGIVVARSTLGSVDITR